MHIPVAEGGINETERSEGSPSEPGASQMSTYDGFNAGNVEDELAKFRKKLDASLKRMGEELDEYFE